MSHGTSGNGWLRFSSVVLGLTFHWQATPRIRSVAFDWLNLRNRSEKECLELLLVSFTSSWINVEMNVNANPRQKRVVLLASWIRVAWNFGYCDDTARFPRLFARYFQAHFAADGPGNFAAEVSCGGIGSRDGQFEEVLAENFFVTRCFGFNGQFMGARFGRRRTIVFSGHYVYGACC